MNAEFWAVVAISAFFGWVLSVFVLIFKIFPSAGSFRSREALILGSLSLVLAVLWFIGLLHA